MFSWLWLVSPPAFSTLGSSFLWEIEKTVAGFAVPPPHHVWHFPPLQLLPALLAGEFVLVWENSSIPCLAPLYRGPYLVLERKNKYFRLQLGSRTDIVSVDWLKPVFSEDPIQAALPPARGQPALRPALHAPDLTPSSTSTVFPARGSARKIVRFKLPPLVPAWWNPHRTVCDRRTYSAISSAFLLGELLWQDDVRQSVPEFWDHNRLKMRHSTSTRWFYKVLYPPY